MKYYIILPQKLVNEENNLNSERYVLGEESFGTFYPDQGYNLLEDLSDRFPELLPHIGIKTSEGEEIDIEEFLDRLDDLTVLV